MVYKPKFIDHVRNALKVNDDELVDGREIHTVCSFGCQGYEPKNPEDTGFIITFESEYPNRFRNERYLVLVHKMEDNE